MTQEELIRNLKYTMEKHKNDNVPAFDTNIYLMCKDILNYLEQEPCEDCIRKQDEIRKAYDRGIKNGLIKGDALSEIEKMPSVQPKPKTGHWIQTSDFFINREGQFIYEFICPECNALSYFRKSNKKVIGANVCPNCGCRMSEVSE